MTESQVIDILIAHMKGQFPRDCPKCGHHFATLRDYCLYTVPLESAMVFDLEIGGGTPQQPLGAMALSNCRCGTTLSLTSKGMAPWQYWRLINWAIRQMTGHGLTRQQLLQDLRDAAHQKVVGEPEPCAA